MKSIPKLIRRFVGILLLSLLLLLFFNFFLLAIVASKQSPNSSPWKTAQEAADALQLTKNGYILPENITAELKAHNIWGIYIDNDTMQVVWHTDNLPDTVPMKYTISEISNLTRGYMESYPTFTGESENGLIVLGYPKDSFWKHMWPSWDYQLIANSPKIILSVILLNAGLLLLISVSVNAKLLKSVKPITNGIQSLGNGEAVCLKEKGLLSEIAANINKTSEVLKSQDHQLRKKESARANWIAGVSHDIRTPLSMVMGYAGQLESDCSLPENERRKASAIRRQSERMRNLINDLNLASKLEYNMQPFVEKKENAVTIVRQVVVDFINTDIYNAYPIEWNTDGAALPCFINADKDLLKRAVSNLLQNCMNHNENGCAIYVFVSTSEGNCMIRVEDDGAGVSDEQIKHLNDTPHYMICDTNVAEQRHGLGLLIVRQVVASHHGTVTIGRSSYGGFAVNITLPLVIERPGPK